MEIIIYAIIPVLILGWLLRYSRTVSERRKCLKELRDRALDEALPVYDGSTDAFMCLMRSDGSNTIYFRGGGGFTANAWKSKEK